jgi:ABC-2 type transport system permease protein
MISPGRQRPLQLGKRFGRSAVWLGLVGGVTLAASGCGSGGITPERLQDSLSRAFSNLYVLQQVEQGNPKPDARSLDTKSACQKGVPGDPQQGPGSDWTCDVTFLVAGPATPVTAIYQLNVQANGCYAADGDGPASVNGSRTVTGPGYQQVHNPLWLIDGCFNL